MTAREVIVRNKTGIHARPAAQIVGAAVKFQSSVFIRKGEDKVNAKSILGVIALGAAYQTRLVIEAEGEDETSAADALVALFSSEQLGNAE